MHGNSRLDGAPGMLSHGRRADRRASPKEAFGLQLERSPRLVDLGEIAPTPHLLQSLRRLGGGACAQVAQRTFQGVRRLFDGTAVLSGDRRAEFEHPLWA